MSELTTTSALALFYTNKEERSYFVRDVINRITEGNEDPEKVLITLKCMEEIIKAITSNKDFKDAVITEATKYGKRHERFNATLDIRETGVRYDYSKCGDLELLSLYTQLDAINEQIKKREAFIKTIPIEGLEVLQSETGEIITIYPPSKTSTTTVAVTLK